MRHLTLGVLVGLSICFIALGADKCNTYRSITWDKFKARNNIIVGSHRYDLEMWDWPNWPRAASPPVRDISHNLFHDNAMIHTAGETLIQADPLFIKMPTALDRDGDFRLRESSPAIDAGVDTGLPRTDNTRKDLGAFDHGRPSWQAGVRENSASE